MKKKFTATVWQEGDWYVAQCIEVDVISQGQSEQEALRNLAEAIQLYFEPPTSTTPERRVLTIEVEMDAIEGGPAYTNHYSLGTVERRCLLVEHVLSNQIGCIRSG